MPTYMLTVRATTNNHFRAEPGEPHFLKLGKRADTPKPSNAMAKDAWVNRVLLAARHDEEDDEQGGNILLLVHGYNTSPAAALAQQRRLETLLKKAGYRGVVVGFDWPSASSALNYLEDRVDAKQSAFALVEHGIRLFTERCTPDCAIKVHVLGYSMGAFVIREAFVDADDRPGLAAVNWSVSQICLVAADISRNSMRSSDPRGYAIYRHAQRVTNYFNPYDKVLGLSNIKRVGTAPRLGRVGLPEDVPDKAVNVDTGPYFDSKYGVNGRIDAGLSHGWYFNDDFFAQDLVYTLQGDIDRDRIPTRMAAAHNRLVLGDEQSVIERSMRLAA